MLVPLLASAILAVAMMSSAVATSTKAGNAAAGDIRTAMRAQDSLRAFAEPPAEYAATRNPAEAGLFRVVARRADAKFAALRAHGYDSPDERKSVAAAIRSWRSARARGLTVISSGDRVQDSALEDFYVSLTATEAALGSLVAATLAERSDERSLATQHRDRQLLVLLLVIAASFALAAGVARWIRRSIARPLRQLRAAVRRFGTGDLNEPVSLDGGREFAQLAVAFNATVDELSKNQAQLTHQAFHDALTDLPNRALLLDRTNHALVRAHSDGGRVTALFLDLDDFKGINDSLGQSAGDRLLVEVARRLQVVMRAEDSVARLGGDEFAVLLEGCDSGQAAGAARRILEVLAPTFRMDGRELLIRASVGVSTSQPGDSNAEELLRYADVAMYAAKEENKGGYRLFEPRMHAQAMERLELEADLRQALEDSAFHVHYQPIVDLDTLRVSGIEALARWTHPVRGPVSPAEFIPPAERTRLIVPLGRFMLERACRDLSELQREPGTDSALWVSVNVSTLELMEDDYVGFVESTLEEAGLAPESLVLEITETVLVFDSESTLARLEELKAVGVRLAVDDFGTGYSSLSYIERLPLDIIKIDKAFVDPVGQPGADADLASVIVSLGQRLGLETVAEGIEAAAQGEELEHMGCQYGQGFHYARPQSLEALRELLAGQSVLAAAAV